MSLYTNTELSIKEIKKTILFTTASKIIKYLGIKLTKEVKDLYIENYKTLMKEIKDMNKLKDILCPWILLFSLLGQGHFFNSLSFLCILHDCSF